MGISERITNLEQIVAERSDNQVQGLFVARIRRGDDGVEVVPPDGYSTAGLDPVFRMAGETDEDFEARCLTLAAQNGKTGVVVFRTVRQNSTDEVGNE